MITMEVEGRTIVLGGVVDAIVRELSIVDIILRGVGLGGETDDFPLCIWQMLLVGEAVSDFCCPFVSEYG